MRVCKCPNCGANLNFDEDGREFIYCQYCGAKIDLIDQRTKHTEHIIDDAKIKNAENISRVVNIFAAPIEERQRQAEFERQRQMEADRREQERQERKEARKREQEEAVSDGCAFILGKLLVFTVKQPLAACVIFFALLVSCMGMASSDSSSSSSSRTASSTKRTVVSSSSSTVSEAFSKAADEITAAASKAADEITAAVSEATDSVSSAYSVAMSEISPSDSTASSSLSQIQMSASAAAQLSYDACYVMRTDNNSAYYAIRYDTDTVRYFETNSDKGILVGSITGGTLDSGMTVRYTKDGSRTEVLRYNSDDDKSIIVTSSGSPDREFVKISSDSVKKVLESGLYDGWTGSRRGASSSASQAASSTTREPSINYTPSHKNTRYDEAYCLRHPKYAIYILVSYQDKIIRYFSYGDGSRSAYVGHITSGSKAKGYIVHYNYDSGWDEKFRVSNSQLILTDAHGDSYTFNQTSLKAASSIYSDRYSDIPENK